MLLTMSLWLLLAVPLASSAIARNRELQSQLNIIATNEESREQRESDDRSNRAMNENQSTIDIIDIDIMDHQEVRQKREESYKGILKVKMVRAKNLPNSDGWWNKPDPYACVEAVNQLNTRYRQCTSVISGTQFPVWNKELNFGESCSGWRYITIIIYDEDPGRHDLMLQSPRIRISPGRHSESYCDNSIECVDYEIIMTVQG